MFACQPVVGSLLSAVQGAANPPNNRGLDLMKAILTAALGAVLLAAIPVEANAVVCAKGVYRAGCAGPHGAVVTRRPVAAGCYYRAGVRVCR